MNGNLIIGLITIAVNLAIQCFVVGILFDVLIALENKKMIKTTFWNMSLLLTALLITMFAGNLLQMTIWAGLFYALGEFQSFGTAFYHSVVNFTTLGYGDIVMSEGRRLLGALEAANGVLMLGITTGFVYTILNGLLQREWDRRLGKK
jgi:hypothetical protein